MRQGRKPGGGYGCHRLRVSREDAIIKMQSLFETANQENSLHRFADKWLDKTVKTVEKSGTVIQVMGYFGIAIAILLLILVMSDLIQQAFFM